MVRPDPSVARDAAEQRADHERFLTQFRRAAAWGALFLLGFATFTAILAGFLRML